MIIIVKYLREYRYEIIAALCGGVVMILELVGARMVAPYFGTSTYVWTAMIGVILGALSVGYWYGGRLADYRANDKVLMQIITLAAFAILVALFFQTSVLEYISNNGGDLRIQAVVAAAVIFAPAAMLLGIVSPFVAKLRISSMRTAGQSIGRLYAAGTIGSIAGTFLAGYWLIAIFGNRALGIMLVFVLLGVSVLALPRVWWWQRIAIGLLALFILKAPQLPQGTVADVDTAYGRYLIMDGKSENRVTRQLRVDRFSLESAQVLGQPQELAVQYIRRFYTALQLQGADRIAVIGGGIYTFPVAAALGDTSLRVDAIEIDAALNDIAKEYFEFKPLSNLTIINEDGRIFLAKAKPNTYDIVYLDAFSALTPPFQLVTKQAATLAKRALTPNGVVIANVVGESADDPYIQAMNSTYESTFRYVRAYPPHEGKPVGLQNYLFVMSDQPFDEERYTAVMGVKPLTIPKNIVMTDDFAPVEQLISH